MLLLWTLVVMVMMGWVIGRWEHHTAMHTATHYGKCSVDAVSENALTSAWKQNPLLCYKSVGGGALPKAPILCQPTTLLCSNPEKGVERQQGADRRVKKTEGKRPTLGKSFTETFSLLKGGWMGWLKRGQSKWPLQSATQAANCSLQPLKSSTYWWGGKLPPLLLCFSPCIHELFFWRRPLDWNDPLKSH